GDSGTAGGCWDGRGTVCASASACEGLRGAAGDFSRRPVVSCAAVQQRGEFGVRGDPLVAQPLRFDFGAGVDEEPDDGAVAVGGALGVDDQGVQRPDDGRGVEPVVGNVHRRASPNEQVDELDVTLVGGDVQRGAAIG